MPLEGLVTQYGYWLLLAGTFLEGESVLVIAGFLAFQGYLELPWVILVAFIGTFLGDQFFFHLGRYKGRALLCRFPRWQARAERALALFNRHQITLVIGFRFLYGIRSVTPFVLGSSGFSPLRFGLLDAIGGILWATLVGILGYLFGRVAARYIEEYDTWLLGGLCLLALVVWLVHHWRVGRGKNS